MSAITGVGIDIEEVHRIRDVVLRWEDRFLHRFFTEKEIAYCSGKALPEQHFAARFAAKEAFSKAMGTGWTGAFRWKDIEIQNDNKGKPFITLYNRLAEDFQACTLLISLSHTRNYVTAVVIIQETI